MESNMKLEKIQAILFKVALLLSAGVGGKSKKSPRNC